VVGFAAVIQATPAYDVMVNGLLGLSIPAPLLVVLAVAILVGLTGSPPAGLAIVVPVLAANLSLAPEAIHRIATTAASTFDTLPFQGAILIMLGMADLKHKDGYPPVLMCTVCWTMAAAVVEGLLFVLIPGLA
jgi:H+/gluconate symporter-like permease